MWDIYLLLFFRLFTSVNIYAVIANVFTKLKTFILLFIHSKIKSTNNP